MECAIAKHTQREKNNNCLHQIEISIIIVNASMLFLEYKMNGTSTASTRYACGNVENEWNKLDGWKKIYKSAMVTKRYLKIFCNQPNIYIFIYITLVPNNLGINNENIWKKFESCQSTQYDTNIRIQMKV